MSRMFIRTAFVGLSSLALLLGCGGDPSKPPLGRVSGTVTYKGKPVPKGLVSFVPAGGEAAKTGQSATGEIGSDGSYSLTTFDKGDGAVLGDHMVLVQAREEDPSIEGGSMPIPDAQGRIKIKPAKELVPTKYGNADSSPLKFTVKAGSQTFNISLED